MYSWIDLSMLGRFTARKLFSSGKNLNLGSKIVECLRLYIHFHFSIHVFI